VYVAPGGFAHPKCQAFWLGGASGAGRVRGRAPRGTVPAAEFFLGGGLAVGPASRARSPMGG